MPFEMDGQRLVPARPLPDAARRPPVGLTVASMPSHAFRKPAAKLAGTLLLSGLIASHASATAPPAAGVAEPAATIRTLLKALQQGDEATASGIYRSATDPVAHVWAAMVLERLHFHLDAANADARLCEDDLIDGKPGIALLCGQFRSGDLRLAGRRGEADEVERELVKRFQGHGVDKALADMRAYLAGDEAASPPLTYDSPGGKVSIPLEEDAWIPSFKAKANGHELDVMLDTGANDLVLGAEQAQAAGVRPLNRKMRIRGWLSSDVHAGRGLLDELRIGSVTLHHVPVTVVPRSIALIGGNLVAPLGTLRISHKDRTLAIYGAGAQAPTCDTPMVAASNLWGTYFRLVPSLLVNDKPQPVLLDTGDFRYLSGTKQALVEATPLHRGKTAVNDIGGTHPFANAELAKVKLTIGGQPIEMYFAVLPDSSVAQGITRGITLGAGALRDMDFVLDFRHGTQCFVLHPGLH